MNETMLYGIILTNIIIFLLGYIIGCIQHKNTNIIGPIGYSVSKEQKKQIEQNKIIEKIQSVDIDESKFVVDADLSGFEKKFEEIAETKESNENIESSISKLSQIMKGK